MAWGKEGLQEALKTAKQVYDQHLIIKTQFENLETNTEKALKNFKELTENLLKKVEEEQKERIKSEKELSASIAKLEARLAALSESAIHVAMRQLVEERVKEESSKRPALISRDGRDDEDKN